MLECVLNHQSHRSGRIGSEGLCVAQNSYVQPAAVGRYTNCRSRTWPDGRHPPHARDLQIGCHGQWTLCCDQGRPLSLHAGLPGVDVPTMWRASETLEDLLTGRESADSIHARGGLAIEAPDAASCDDAMRIMRQLTLPLAARHRPVQPA